MINPTKTSCHHCPAQCLSIFQNLNESLLDEIKNIKTHQIFKKGDILFHQGSPSFGLYCIESGSVKLFIQGDDGREIISQIASAGDLIDVSSLFHAKDYQVSAKALGQVKCCFIEKTQIKEFTKKSEHINLNLFKLLEHNLIAANLRGNELILKNLKNRLASYLVRMAPTSSPHHEIKFAPQLSREELAGYLGSAHETVIRCLTEFKDLGYIREENRTFYILNPDKLYELSGENS